MEVFYCNNPAKVGVGVKWELVCKRWGKKTGKDEGRENVRENEGGMERTMVMDRIKDQEKKNVRREQTCGSDSYGSNKRARRDASVQTQRCARVYEVCARCVRCARACVCVRVCVLACVCVC